MRIVFTLILSSLLFIASFTPASIEASEIDLIPAPQTEGELLVSGDGLVAAGVRYDSAYNQIYRWTKQGGLEVVYESFAPDISYPTDINFDGSVIVGYSTDTASSMGNYYQTGFRWTPSGGLNYLDGSKAVLEPHGYFHAAYSVSGDGGFVVGGMGGRGPIHEGLLCWEESEGVVDHGLLPGREGTLGVAVSEDGNIVVGNAVDDKTTWTDVFFTWSEASGFKEIGFGYATDISADGKVIVGVTGGGSAFRHTESGGMEEIGSFIPKRTNGNGSVIVGEDVIWDKKNGVQSIQAYLISKGVDVVSDNWIFNGVTDISTDGSVIVGFGGSDSAPETEIVDNLHPGFSTGPHNWSWSFHWPDAYHIFYQYTPPGDGTEYAKWTFSEENRNLRGHWEVLAQWPAAGNRAEDATYTISGAYGEIATVVVDQTKDGGRFNSLGVFYTDKPTEVVLNSSASGYVIADAVKIVYIDNGWMATTDSRPRRPNGLQPRHHMAKQLRVSRPPADFTRP